jgi:hypothetical protein
MIDDAWKLRLSQAIKDAGKSPRSVSLATGNGPGYVHSILKEGKKPTVENLIAVCDVIPVSLVWVLYGTDVAPDDLEIIRALRGDPATRQAILALIRPRSTS